MCEYFGRVQTWCPCQDAVPWALKGMLFRHRAWCPKFNFNLLRCSIDITLLFHVLKFFVRAQLKCYVHVGARTQAPNMVL